MDRDYVKADREVPEPRVRPSSGAPRPLGVAAVMALQRSVGNQTVSRFMPVPPGTPAAVGHLVNKTDLERVVELLTYSVGDWAITDDDAAKATRILSDMGDGELTAAVATLDGDSTPYLDRLAENATIATVRTAGFAKTMAKRSPARNGALAKQLVSYGIVDWEVTPPEAEAAQILLDCLPEGDRDRIADDWLRSRVKENLAGKGDAEQGVGEQLLDGAIQGDYIEDPTFWNVCAQIGVGFIPYAGQVADIRDLIHALDDLFLRGGYKKAESWIQFALTVVGFVPGFGDAIKAVGKGAMKVLKKSLFRAARGLWDRALRHLVEPLVKALLPDLVGKFKAGLRELLERWGRKLADANPHGPREVPAGAIPSAGELAKSTDTAFEEAAKQAPRRIGDAASEIVHSAINRLRKEVEEQVSALEFVSFEVEVKGDDLVIYGIGSKFTLMRANIRSVKTFVITKSDSMLRALRSREARLTAAELAEQAGAETAGVIRNGAVLVTEEIGERVADIVIKREFKGARVRFTGSGSGTLDKVFELDGVLHIVEAKGGSGRIGSRGLASGLRAEQGTAAYVVDVLLNMVKRGGDEAAIAEELLTKIKKPGTVRLWVSSTGALNASSKEKIVAKLMECALP